MSDALLPCVELEPPGDARASVLWLHGLGADGHDFEPIAPELGLDGLGVRFVFPHAPAQPVTINGGMVMPAWYDILAMELERKVDEDGVRASSQALEQLIARERERGVPARSIIVAGFSQGGAIALHTAVRYPERLAGCLALSTYMVRGASLEAERSDANRDLPLFHAHGSLDPMVPCQAGENAYRQLSELGYPGSWQTYPMAHQVCAEEIAAVGGFIRSVLAADE